MGSTFGGKVIDISWVGKMLFRKFGHSWIPVNLCCFLLLLTSLSTDHVIAIMSPLLLLQKMIDMNDI